MEMVVSGKETQKGHQAEMMMDAGKYVRYTPEMSRFVRYTPEKHKRVIEIQAKISERALELLALPNDGIPRLLLDIGCGSGLSGETLSENGHHWIGYDISSSMLDVALEREAEGDLLLADMGQVNTHFLDPS